MTTKRTKKTAALALIIGAALAAQGGCKKQIVDPPEELSSGYVTVTFHPNGGEMAPQTQTVKKDELAAIPKPAPLLKSHTFAGWYTDNTSFLNVYDFKTPVREPFDLYAKWTPGSQSGTDDVGEQDADLPPDEQDFGKGVSPEAITSFTAANKAEWDVAVTAINNAGDGTDAAPKNYIININGNFQLPGGAYYQGFPNQCDFTFTPKHSAVSIRGLGDGRELSLSSSGSMLVTAPSQILMVRSITLKGTDSNNAALITIGEASLLYLRKGVKVTGNTNTSGGGGVAIIYGSLIMRDNAEISGNTCGENCEGGGATVFSGTAILRDDAAISNNRTGNSGEGGGVSVDSKGTLIMRDRARIFGNVAGEYGGGIKSSGSFYISGGTIYGSDEKDASLKNAASWGAGALYANGAISNYGIFNTLGEWIPKGTLGETVDTTVAVVNGVLQPPPASP